MKLLLLLLPVFLISFKSNAQDKKDKWQKPGKEWNFQRPLRIITPKDSSLLTVNPYLNKKPGIYRLKDGMPCVVPDTKDVAVIPNAWKGPLRGTYKGKKPTIPNPLQPDTQPDTK